MTSQKLPPHISKQFDNELENIRSQVMAMGGLVEQQLTLALKALTESDVELAGSVIENERQVNTFEVNIDEECTRILARRQPAAGDLRLVTAVGKTITDLERIGDEAERVGRMALHFAEGAGENTKALMGIRHLGEHVKNMLHDALDAFARMDVEAALAVAREDFKVDEEYENVLRQTMTYMMEDPRSIPRVVNIMWSARALERIGDRARNICEYVIYLVRGKDIRHTSIEQVEKEARSHYGKSPRK